MEGKAFIRSEAVQADLSRIVIVDLHPVFSKPAGHRGMEIYENPATGKQQLDTYIKVPRYLNIPPTLSEAVRGQPEPLVGGTFIPSRRQRLSADSDS